MKMPRLLLLSASFVALRLSAATVPAGLVDLTEPSGTRVSSDAGVFHSSTPVANAFNDNIADRLLHMDAQPEFSVVYTFDQPTVVTAYSIRNVDANNAAVNPKRAVKAWRFEGYDEAKVAWQVLDTRDETEPFAVSEQRSYGLASRQAYAKYRLYVTANFNGGKESSGNYVTHLSEIELYDARSTVTKKAFAKRLKLTCGEVAEGVTLTDFPVLVRLSESGEKGFRYADVLTGDQGDLLFMDEKGRILPYEIDTWNPSGESTVWVKLSELRKGAAITMYYGADAKAANGAGDVWTKYAGVWHFKSAASTDSVSGSEVTLQDDTKACDALVGRGFEKTRALCYLPTTMTFGKDPTTLSCWINPQSAPSHARIVSTKGGAGDTGLELLFAAYQTIMLRGDGNANQVKWTGAKTADVYPVKSWHQYAATFDGAAGRIFMDGEMKAEGEIAPVTVHGGQRFAFGAMGGSTASDIVQGQMDELRIYNGIAPAGWLHEEWASIASTTYVSVGEARDNKDGLLVIFR